MTLDGDLAVHYEYSEKVSAALWKGIIEFNKTTGPMLKYPPYEPMAIVIKNGKKQIVAGILAKVYLKCLYVEVLWVSEGLRKKGLGTQLLAEMEKIAREKDCTFMHLDTFSFQAIDFYKKYGYAEFGRLEDYPDGIVRYYLKKYLK